MRKILPASMNIHRREKHFFAYRTALICLLLQTALWLPKISHSQDRYISSYTGQSVITTPSGTIYLVPNFVTPNGTNLQVYIGGSNNTGGGGKDTVPSISTNFSSAYNYIASWTATAPDADPNHLITRPLKDAKLTVQYFDGLGRPLQTVVKQGSLETATGTSKDLVTPIVYDALGRDSVKYLPYVDTGTADGSYKTNALAAQPNFYNNTSILSGQGENGVNALSKNIYEASPLNRLLKTMAPGNSWVGNNVGVGQGYWINTAADDVKMWDVSTVPTAGSGFGNYTLHGTGAYPAGQLYKNITTDEVGHQIIEFKDLDDHIVLRKVQNTANIDDGNGQGYLGWLCTYYLYDDLGNLRCVIQPKGVEWLSQNNWNLTNPTILAEQCFRYEYDQWNRMIIKQVPGAGPVYRVYDFRNRPVMVQDADLRGNNQWILTIYDSLNRPVKTGTFLGSTGDFTTHLAAAYNSTNYLSGTAIDVLAETHYDNYTGLSATGLQSSFMGDWNGEFQATDNTSYPYPQMPAQNSAVTTQGSVTWTGRKVINPQNGISSYLTAVNIYDDKGKVIQTQSQNINGGVNVMTTQYTWTEQPLIAVSKTENPTAANKILTVASRTTYDDLGRIIKTETKQSNNAVNSGNMTTYATTIQMQYDAMGQLSNRLIGSQRSDANTYTGAPLETQVYDYNVRGWLLGMNRAYVRGGNSTAFNPIANNGGSGETFTEAVQTAAYLPSGNYFGFDLGYDKTNNNLVGGQTYAKAQVNGNISGVVWKSAHDGMVRKYDFDYDSLKRFKSADFNQYNGSIFDRSANVNYSITNLNYDANGNILSMRQNSLKPDGTSPLIDQLGYTYLLNSNKLQQVIDTANDNNSTLGDFKYDPNAKTGADYTYDANGNLTSDNNKGITRIVYNYLNLPQTITIPGKGTIDFSYDATGVKLQKKTVDLVANTQTLTTYLGNGAIYQNTSPINQTGAPDTLQFFDMGAGRGRITPVGNFVYDYYLFDAQNNVRMVLTDDYNVASPILEANSYAPFGLRQKNIGLQQTGSLHNWKSTFQKQEFNEDLGLNTYEFKHRMDDPQIGRFWQIDPLSDKYEYNGPYNFSENKVTGDIELDGLESISINAANGLAGETWVKTSLKANNFTFYQQVTTRPENTTKLANTRNDFLAFDDEDNAFYRIEVKTGGAENSTNQSLTEKSIGNGEMQEMRSASSKTSNAVRTGRQFKIGGSITVRVDPKTGRITIETKTANPKVKTANNALNKLEGALSKSSNENIINHAAGERPTEIPIDDLTPVETVPVETPTPIEVPTEMPIETPPIEIPIEGPIIPIP